MDQRHELERMADAILDQHRSGPPPAVPGEGLDGLDAWRQERIERARERHARLESYEAVFTLLGAALLVAGAFAWLGMF